MSDVESMDASTIPVDDSPSANISSFRKYTLLLLFCASQFLDAFNVSALFSAIPIMTTELDLNASEAVWLVSAYQLTFASFLLCSGRISDLYNPKYGFVVGNFTLGMFSLGAGFCDNKIGLFVLRALSGVSAAMTIPSSLTLLEQAGAIGVYGGSAALGNVLGLILGALLIQYANWSWVFWLGTLVATPVGLLALLLTPPQPKVYKEGSKISYLDLPGIFVVTAALILLIFAFTESGINSWSSAIVLAPLIISIALIAFFFFYETWIPADKAAIPPSTWKYPNFGVLVGLALSCYLWFAATFFIIITMWQEVYLWSAVKSAVHFLPIGLIAGPLMLFSAPFTARFEAKYVLLTSIVLIMISTVMLPFADSQSKYWRLDFPAFVIGAIGGSLLFVNCNIAVFGNTPPEIAGVIGAAFNSALQLGSAVGLAIITTIQLSVDGRGERDPTKNPYDGRAAAFWFLLAVMGVEGVAVLIFYRTKASRPQDNSTQLEGGQDGVVEKESGHPGELHRTNSSNTASQSAPLSRSDTVVEGEAEAKVKTS
ncbi:MFS general substrate transporter [Auriculariales sp. MPI-PUGE-AT-0066]|nr:MFS general substrate transporter [Auriculariales sp. MPI-PUGE-AT-0066]